MFYTDWYDVLGSKMLSMRTFENLPQNIAADVDFYANNKNQRRPTSLDMSMMLESLFDVFLRNKQDDKIKSIVKSVLIELGTAIRLNNVYKQAFVQDNAAVLKLAALSCAVFGGNTNFDLCKELYPGLRQPAVLEEMRRYGRCLRFKKQRQEMLNQGKPR